MAEMIFKRGNFSSLSSLIETDGQLIVTIDEGAAYVDTNIGRKRLGDFNKVDNISSLPASPFESLLYYAEAENVLVVWDGSAWIQVNKQPTVTELKALLTGVYDLSGSAAAVLGAAGDTSSNTTVYGAIALANEKVTNVTAIDNTVSVDNTDPKKPKIGANISTKEGNYLKVETTVGKEGLYVAAPPDGVIYSIEKAASAETGYFATYNLTADNVATGASINIPKDFLVKSAEVKTASASDLSSVIYNGVQTGDKYIDFVINTVQGDGEVTHIYLPVNELVDTYTAGNGIYISESNVVSMVVKQENGISLTSNGLELALATASTAGAMSATDKDKLDGIAVNANNYVHPNDGGSGFAAGLYKITVNAAGHIIAAASVTKTDITALGIPGEDTGATSAVIEGSGNVIVGVVYDPDTRKLTFTKGNVVTDISGKVDKDASVTANNVTTFIAGGNIKDSGASIGGATLASTPSASVLATEVAVKSAIVDALTWGTF